LARDDRPWNGDDPPGVAFTYAPGRSGKYAETILEGFSGILQVDGYAGYNRLLRRTDQSIELAYCWAHARRKLYEITKNSTAPIAEAGLKQIAALYRIETDIRGQNPEARLATRQERSAPRIKAFEEWLREHRSKVSRKSPLGEALKYIAKYWDGLCLFLTDGHIEMDNNAVERTIRPIALNRKMHSLPVMMPVLKTGQLSLHSSRPASLTISSHMPISQLFSELSSMAISKAKLNSFCHGTTTQPCERRSAYDLLCAQ